MNLNVRNKTFSYGFIITTSSFFNKKNYICSNKNIYYFVYWMCLKFKNIFIVQVHIKTKVLKKYLRLKIKVVYVNYNILS